MPGSRGSKRARSTTQPRAGGAGAAVTGEETPIRAATAATVQATTEPRGRRRAIGRRRVPRRRNFKPGLRFSRCVPIDQKGRRRTVAEPTVVDIEVVDKTPQQ